MTSLVQNKFWTPNDSGINAWDWVLILTWFCGLFFPLPDRETRRNPVRNVFWADQKRYKISPKVERLQTCSCKTMAGNKKTLAHLPGYKSNLLLTSSSEYLAFSFERSSKKAINSSLFPSNSTSC